MNDKSEICETPHLTIEEEHECEIRNIANKLHCTIYEVERERESSWGGYRDFITFEGMPLEYQDTVINVVKRLIDYGVIKPNER